MHCIMNLTTNPLHITPPLQRDAHLVLQKQAPPHPPSHPPELPFVLPLNHIAFFYRHHLCFKPTEAPGADSSHSSGSFPGPTWALTLWVKKTAKGSSSCGIKTTLLFWVVPILNYWKHLYTGLPSHGRSHLWGFFLLCSILVFHRWQNPMQIWSHKIRNSGWISRRFQHLC